MSENYKYKDITGKIIGAGMQVHSILGNGFQEVILKSIESRFRSWLQRIRFA